MKRTILALSILGLWQSIPASAQTLTIGGYQLVKEQVVKGENKGYIHDLTYRANITNSGPSVKGVTATCLSLVEYTVVIDDSLSFGDVANSATKRSSDTFILRHDKRKKLDFSQLRWTISTSSANRPPVANAGPDQSTYVTNTVTLNGSSSSDPDGNPLTYAWSWVSKPAGSGAALSNPTSSTPSFTVDKSGIYVVQLELPADRQCRARPDGRRRRDGAVGWKPVQRPGSRRPHVRVVVDHTASRQLGYALGGQCIRPDLCRRHGGHLRRKTHRE